MDAIGVCELVEVQDETLVLVGVPLAEALGDCVAVTPGECVLEMIFVSVPESVGVIVKELDVVDITD